MVRLIQALGRCLRFVVGALIERSETQQVAHRSFRANPLRQESPASIRCLAARHQALFAATRRLLSHNHHIWASGGSAHNATAVVSLTIRSSGTRIVPILVPLTLALGTQ